MANWQYFNMMIETFEAFDVFKSNTLYELVLCFVGISLSPPHRCTSCFHYVSLTAHSTQIIHVLGTWYLVLGKKKKEYIAAS